MKLSVIMEAVPLQNLTPELPVGPDVEVTGGHASDLLSDVLANAPRGGLLVTQQVHMNVVAVASHCELSAVVFAGARRPDDNVRARASGEGIRLFATERSTWDVVGRLYALGVRGGRG